VNGPGFAGAFSMGHTTVDLCCSNCGKQFQTLLKYEKSRKKRGRSGPFCSRSCVASSRNRKQWDEQRVKMLQTLATALRHTFLDKYMRLQKALNKHGHACLFEVVLYDDYADGIYDLIINDALIIELGQEGNHHTVEHDKRKDFLAERLGYDIVRLEGYDVNAVIKAANRWTGHCNAVHLQGRGKREQTRRAS
jgi:very-short-patch-repair endonuclease